MKEVCNHCGHQKHDGRGGVVCGLVWHIEDEHGRDKRGSVCVHDNDLRDCFNPRTDESPSVIVMSELLHHRESEIVRMRDKIFTLEKRLLDTGL